MNLEQLHGESDLDYQRRLIYGKLVDKTLADIDFSELANLVYGQDYSSDVARRMMYGSRKTLELVDKEMERMSVATQSSESDVKIRELKAERQKMFDQRRELNKIERDIARQEYIDSKLIEAAESLNETIGPLFGEAMYADNEIENSEAVLVFSDWHYGMVVDNVFNKYDTDICKNRVQAVVNNAINRIKVHKCNALHLILLGDAFHGAIHTSVRVASEELVVDQIMQVSEIIAQAINALSMFVPGVYVYTTYGNHGRVVSNKKDSIHKDNLERIVGWWLKQRLKDNERVTMMPDSGTEFVFVNACGHDICAVHGDLDSVRTSPRLLTTLFFKEYQKNIECIILGDKHHRESFEELGVVSMICGALCGSDDYANEKRLFSKPNQLLLIFDENGLDAEYRIRCD
jgi:hypothetical protein